MTIPYRQIRNDIICPCSGGGGGAILVLGFGIFVNISTGIAPEVETTTSSLTTEAAASAAAHTVGKTSKKKQSETYSVYFLADQRGVIQYVGRVKDRYYDARMRYHASTRGLIPKHRISGLTYEEARGLEEIGMLECHTLNALNTINNQIHGISSGNPNIEIYLEAACNYLQNRTENALLNIFG